MKDPQFNRRKFLRNTAATAAGMAFLPSIPKNVMANIAANTSETSSNIIQPYAEPRIRFSVISINHGHINSMVNAVIRGGGQFVSFYAKEPELVVDFAKRFPQAKIAASEDEILNDPTIQVVLSSGIPVERAPLGIRVMQHGKDYLVDKPGITTLDQLAEARRVQKATGRIYSIMFSERFENKATVKAGELVKAGAIGKVIQTIGLGPHKMTPKTRPEWFFDKKYFGGIITDIGSHQFDQFLFFTGSTKAEVVASQVGNTAHPQYPNFEDFGDIMLSGNGGSGYSAGRLVHPGWTLPHGVMED